MSTLKLYGWAEEDGKDVVFTPWTLVHVAAGYVAKSVGVDIVEWNLFHGLYECKDMLYPHYVCMEWIWIHVSHVKSDMLDLRCVSGKGE